MKLALRVVAAAPEGLTALAPQLAALPLLQAYGQTAAGLQNALLRAHDEGEGLLVALDAVGRPLGLAWFAARGGLGLAAYLRLLAVVPQARSRGVGRTLLAAFEAATDQAHGGHLVLCNAKNAPALAFYRAHGYAQVGLLYRFVRPEHDEVLLHKPRP